MHNQNLQFSPEGMSLLQDPKVIGHICVLLNQASIAAEANAFTYLILTACADSKGRCVTDDETIASFWADNTEKLHQLMSAITGGRA